MIRDSTVTGATGFVGKAVVQRLLAEDESRCVAVAVRRDVQQWPARVRPRVTGDLEPATDWSVALGVYRLSCTVPPACM